ncbi:MAG: hypothetical protein LBT40_04880 [Deltaproteobacteria bacterium]|jgi:hypothetical protein|nr:hypothetical protein [Deltaproteobacteria bacterium]
MKLIEKIREVSETVMREPEMPWRVESELRIIESWTSSEEGTFLPGFRKRKELYDLVVKRPRRHAPDGSLVWDIPVDRLRELPPLLFDDRMGEVVLRTERDFRHGFIRSLDELPRQDADLVLRSLWLELVRNFQGADPSVSVWTRTLADMIRDDAPEDLLFARSAVLRYGAFENGGAASKAVADFARARMDSGIGARPEGVSLSGRGLVARLSSVCSALAAAPATDEAPAHIDMLRPYLDGSEDDNLLKFIGDDPETGFGILGALATPLSSGPALSYGQESPSWASDLRADIMSAIRRIFSDPDDCPVCFWNSAPLESRAFLTAKAFGALELFFGEPRTWLDTPGSESRAAYWAALVIDGTVNRAWPVFDAACIPESRGVTDSSTHGLLNGGSGRLSVLLLRMNGLTVADWSDGRSFAWKDGSVTAPRMGQGDYSARMLSVRKGSVRLRPGRRWRKKMDSLVSQVTGRDFKDGAGNEADPQSV